MARSSNTSRRSRRSCATMASPCSMSRASSPLPDGGAGMDKLLNFMWVLLVVPTLTVSAADFSAEQVREILAVATPDKRADLSGKSLENLDLSNVDFKKANLSGANLFGAKLDS